MDSKQTNGIKGVSIIAAFLFVALIAPHHVTNLPRSLTGELLSALIAFQRLRAVDVGDGAGQW